MVLKKISCVGLSAVMATTLMVPFTALADQQPSVEYTGGNGDPITHLYLIADDSNLANNYTEAWNKEHAKVEVPVAIHYVAQADGTIVGPNDEAAQIRNFAGFPVNVSNILTTAGTNVTLVSTPEAADQADEIYLQMKPNNGTVVSLADFTVSATESSTGLADGTGKRPEAGTEWNIAAAVSGVGTENAVASILNLNSLSGKIGGFNQLNPAAEQEIGQINWQIKPGTYVAPAPALPTTSTFSSTSISDLHEIGEYLVGPGKTDTAYTNQAKALVGRTISVALNDGKGTMTARLVSVDNTRGLTFEAKNCLTFEAMNSSNTNEGGWAASDLRTSLNSGTIYNMYFSNSALAGKVRQVTNSSYSHGGFGVPGEPNTSSDYYWIPSANNIFGAGWYNNPSSFEQLVGFSDGDTQFDYYADMTLDSTGANSNAALVKYYNRYDYQWWLRSAEPLGTSDFMEVSDEGYLTTSSATSNSGVAPCFCL